MSERAESAIPAWVDIDRSDWPEIQSPDFGGVDSQGNPVMIPVCPGCGLYDGNDEEPDDHFDDLGPCWWRIAHENGRSEP